MMPIFPTETRRCTKIAIHLKLRRPKEPHERDSIPVVKVVELVSKDGCVVEEVLKKVPMAVETSGLEIKELMDELANELEVS